MAAVIGLDRLERFFTRRKASTASSNQSSEPSSPTTPTDVRFPSPSYIRPKTSRMAARDEFCKHEAVKPPSFGGTHSPQRKTYSGTYDGKFGIFNARMPPPLVRTMDDSLVTTLQDLEFPKSPSGNNAIDILMPQFTQFNNKALVDVFEQHPIRPSPPLKLSIRTTRLNTPLSSDQEDDLSPTSTNPGKIFEVACGSQEFFPTPELSPELRPSFDSQLRGFNSVDIMDKSLCWNVERQLEEAYVDCSVSHLSLPNSPSEELSSTYEEPCIQTFLSLEDNEVAEPYSEDLFPDTQMEQSTSYIPLYRPPFLTLTPPRPSHQAAIAAFEAARIATRYSFDMLYIVNLWSKPYTQSFRHVPTEAPMANMKGAILAAYGLHHAPSPFQVSTEVHTKILSSNNWLEYREQQPQTTGFGCAYACAFHVQNASDHGSIQLFKSGIVFAAYRKPTADGYVKYVDMAGLALLRRDAETLVEMIIDMDAAYRKDNSIPKAKYAKETGPLPSVHSLALH